MSETSTLYDQIPYPGSAFLYSHPDRLAVMATLNGLTPVPVDQCRVLELGCGEGNNLIPMAYGLPQSEFVGIDLALTPIEQGRETINHLKLDNVRLYQKDVMEVGAEYGKFDYIIAHGLFSWVPEFVQQRILELCRQNLNPNGVAYISYNTYPGCHIRQIFRDAMLFHTRDIEDPAEKVAQGMGMLRFLQTSRKESLYTGRLFDFQTKATLARPPAVLFHDEFAPFWKPMYFRDFVEQASRCGLQYLSETEWTNTDGDMLSEEASEFLRAVAEHDLLAFEQYVDFIRVRSFRRTLLCNAEHSLDRNNAAQAARELLVTSSATYTESDGSHRFTGAKPEGRFATNHPLWVEGLRKLIDESPRGLTVKDLFPANGNEQEIGATLIKLNSATVLGLHTWLPQVTKDPGERPLASRLARMQAALQPNVTTLLHTQVSLDDARSRKLLILLDGTHTRRQIADAMDEGVTVGEVDQQVSTLAKMGLIEV